MTYESITKKKVEPRYLEVSVYRIFFQSQSFNHVHVLKYLDNSKFRYVEFIVGP